ncbi:MAG: 16S rRNA (adenine(1518)-N(6)/adenine(1519)-N(6))-dimethyltransferase RsmA, partial [Richelia sp. RM2_1_2]|nr:16S rRNA (adenine(1518)-N(6)/adenine(1519)-N(6))-dimethyltransferase RsmA [Richelia sp. SM1_7_0]NJO60414.1 16S rRNA (adenine(1518)-N(6)/adenine(1519)-N(6))-dimethyltransferase RsmA [Richelia sp. RM2_1_2]
SDKALSSIIKTADLQDTDKVLEIGPGQGILTQQLIDKVKSLVAVEIDSNLSQLLMKKLGEKENFLLLNEDFLTLDLPDLVKYFPSFQNQNKVVANIPYNITGPIIEKLLGKIGNPNPQPYDLIVLLVQKEVAERIVAKPGRTSFGALSVRVQYLADCQMICTVPSTAFYPPPKVDSAVIKLVPCVREVVAKNPRRMETLVKLGFSAKRKMLRNNLQSIIDRDNLTQLLEKLSVNPQARAEELSVMQWVSLANELENQDA